MDKKVCPGGREREWKNLEFFRPSMQTKNLKVIIDK